MKLITAIVRPDRLDDVIVAVAGNGGRGLTVSEVMGFGQQYGHFPATAVGDC
jgi:nitrogen regulatory protein PII